jgi:hypothetical protein
MAAYDNVPLPTIEEACLLPGTPIFYRWLAERGLKELDTASRHTFLSAMLYLPSVIEKRCNSLAIKTGFKSSGTMPLDPKALLLKCPFIRHIDQDKVMEIYPKLIEESAKEGFITEKVWYDTGLVDIFEQARHDYETQDLLIKKEKPEEGWKKPPSREHKTLIQRDFEHLSHPKRMKERYTFYKNQEEENLALQNQRDQDISSGKGTTSSRKTFKCSNIECQTCPMMSYGLPGTTLS